MTGPPSVGVTAEVFEWYLDQTLDAMLAACRTLGNERLNQRPSLGGANSPYAIVTHVLGVMNFWGGQVIAGREISRDRAAEFTAQGTLAELEAAVEAGRRQLAADLATLVAGDAPRRPPPPPSEPGVEPEIWLATQGGVALHIYEELSQHLGQMEITRDILVAG